MRILVVEDSASMRSVIRLMVTRPGDVVHECADGADALGAYARFRPDWVTMDLRLGRVDGITATGQIKENFPEARILIVTQHRDEALRAAAARAGACGYVLKENLAGLRELMTGGDSPNPSRS